MHDQIKTNTIVSTTNFKSKHFWIKRTVMSLAAIITLLIWNFESNLLNFTLFTCFATAIFLTREEDLLVDESHLYHLRTSLLPNLSSVEKYELSHIKSFKSKSYSYPLWYFLDNKNLKGIDTKIEVTFNNSSSTKIDININQKEMEQLSKTITAKIAKEG
ncbi:hypothetical protein RCC89_15745 [Cytophagaceae bacterium ABcell3]|nr:hypothetical protein RCC89_15745 [Cytophagaceae bacterium ABcell3]